MSKEMSFNITLAHSHTKCDFWGHSFEKVEISLQKYVNKNIKFMK